MERIEMDTGLSRKAKALRDSVREFGRRVVRPAGIALDRIPDPAEAISERSVLWDVFRKFREMGFHKWMIPKAFGGMQEKAPAEAADLIAEELGYADAGLAVSLVVSSMPFTLAVFSPEAEVRNWARAYAEDKEGRMIGCWGITEPDHGSDWVLGTTGAGGDPRLAPSLRAEKKGDEYILNGQKSAWVSNGTIATHAVLHVSLDPSQGMHGQGTAFCPLDLPGISRGKPLNKIGQRALNQGEIIFEDVKLPGKYMFARFPGALAASGMSRAFLGVANGHTGLMICGLARAALDEALDLKREDLEAKGSILEDQGLRITLFDMFTRVESARALAHKVAEHNHALLFGWRMKGLKAPLLSSRAAFWMTSRLIRRYFDLYARSDRSRTARYLFERISRSGRTRMLSDSGKFGVAAKVLATQTAFRVASDAMQLLGDRGPSRDLPIEKMLRDARASMIEDGANEVLALAASETL